MDDPAGEVPTREPESDVKDTAAEPSLAAIEEPLAGSLPATEPPTADDEWATPLSVKKTKKDKKKKRTSALDWEDSSEPPAVIETDEAIKDTAVDFAAGAEAPGQHLEAADMSSTQDQEVEKDMVMAEIPAPTDSTA